MPAGSMLEVPLFLSFGVDGLVDVFWVDISELLPTIWCYIIIICPDELQIFNLFFGPLLDVFVMNILIVGPSRIYHLSFGWIASIPFGRDVFGCWVLGGGTD
ncbi:hypothetical protein BS78_02G290900 [Paspalum vaginatum]|nr:hypothetical protein BS78_02G290900 [Paspalum vaginatum]